MLKLVSKDRSLFSLWIFSKLFQLKPKNGEFLEGKVNDKTGIITWEFMQGISGSKSVFFDYSIDAQYGIPLYLE